MRFSAISSRVKSWVSISTLDGSLEMAAGAVDTDLCEELHRKTLLNDWKKDVVDVGIAAGLRDSARSLSTAAFIR